MKNTLIDLNDHLFAQLERLSDEDLKGEELESELKRQKGITEVARNIVDNAKVVLDARKFLDNSIDAETSVPKILLGNKDE